MRYRDFGKSGYKPSALGFGAMRLPVRNGNFADIDEGMAIAMIRKAIDSGINYIDTAYPYHGGKSEVVVGKALADGYREQVKLTTKLPVWMVEKVEDFDRLLTEQLIRLNTDHIDYYLLHGLNEKRWPLMQKLNVLGWAEDAIADGRIKGLGFSFHDRFEVFEQIIKSYDHWAMCQIYLNFMTTDQEAGLRGARLAGQKSIPVVVMGPIWGGLLAAEPPEGVKQILNNAPVMRSSAEWALAWIWSQPEVSLALSGMSTMAQLDENLDIAERCGDKTLSELEMRVIEKVKEAYRRLYPIACTSCQYCLPCPQGISIPQLFQRYNLAISHNDLKNQRFAYMTYVSVGDRANQCTECGQCEEQCPQKLEIINWMKKIHELLSGGK